MVEKHIVEDATPVDSSVHVMSENVQGVNIRFAMDIVNLKPHGRVALGILLPIVVSGKIYIERRRPTLFDRFQ